METNDYTLNDVRRAVNVLENHHHTRDYQALEEILPLVLVILKSYVKKSNLPEGSNKFYAPIWVDTLLERLSTDEHPLSEEEYQAFRADVEKLSVNDYKVADDDLFGYIPVFTSIEGITEVVLALKHYFGSL
ncbi:MAG: hypothetical protein HDS14_03315 [Bacteroides sp.]|nr:hypothetical protein [Bacteroides sp.]